MENLRAFLIDLAEVLEADNPVDSGTVLTDENWDSLAHISTIALIDEHFDVTISGSDLQSAETVGQIVSIVEAKEAT